MCCISAASEVKQLKHGASKRMYPRTAETQRGLTILLWFDMRWGFVDEFPVTMSMFYILSNKNNWKLLPLCHDSAVTFNNVAMPIKCVRVVGLHESFVTNGGTQWIHAWLWPVAQTKFSFFKVCLVNKGWAAVVFQPYISGLRANRRLYANQEDCPPSFAKETTFRGQMLYKFLQQVNIPEVFCL